MTPSFLARLRDPTVQTVLLCGCGGGFDFVHGLLLHPELARLEKRIVIASHSFGDPEDLQGDVRVVFEEAPAVVKRVTAETLHSESYAVEVHVCSFLDARHPEQAPHFVYASNARTFSVPTLGRFYAQVVAEHEVDAIVLVDGGSDALVVGDERGLGDPIEDAVSVQAVAGLSGVSCRFLLAAGLGVDRYNGVSDASALRAVAELTAQGAFLGATAIERGSEAHRFYRACVEHVYDRQTFRSTVTSAVLAAIEGRFGTKAVPRGAGADARPDTLFVWPPMAVLWAFDVEAVARRSQLGGWLRDAQTPAECYDAVRTGRRALGERIRAEERLPEPSPWPWEGLFDAP